MDEIPQQTDIAIIGAGVGGCIAALALSSRYSVSLIDKNETPPPRVGECLPPASKRIFGKLNLDKFPGEGHLAAMGMESWWGSKQAQISDNLRNPDGLGWHLDRQLLEQDLREETQSRGVNCYWPYVLDTSEPDESGWLLSFASKSEKASRSLKLKAKIVIDATGRHCTFARQRGAKRLQADRLVSVWMTFCSNDNNHLASICPDKDGWWYCAPIPGLPNSSDQHRGNTSAARVLSYQTDADLLPKNFTNREALWCAAKSLPEFATRLSLADESSVMHHGMVAANSSLIEGADFKRWFAIGDGAMSFDPLSSQGMFNAMASAMQLSDLLLVNDIESESALSTISQEYRLQLHRIWDYYLKHRNYFYSQEFRWPESEFWYRRKSA